MGAETMPTWIKLTDHDKAQVVLFLRTAEDEGLEYAWENYAPEFSDALAEVRSGQEVRDMFGFAYRSLEYGDEFWRLYEMGNA